MAKSRIAPTKALTLPQFELTATLIGARLASYLQGQLTLTYNQSLSLVWQSDCPPLALQHAGTQTIHCQPCKGNQRTYLSDELEVLPHIRQPRLPAHQRYQNPATRILGNLERRTFLAPCRIPMAFLVPNRRTSYTSCQPSHRRHNRSNSRSHRKPTTMTRSSSAYESVKLQHPFQASQLTSCICPKSKEAMQENGSLDCARVGWSQKWVD